MNATPSSPEDRAADEAIDWIIMLAEEPDDLDLRAEFERWFAFDAQNQEAWRHANKVSNLVGQSHSVAFLTPASKSEPISGLPRPRFRRWPILASAAIAACLSLVLAPEAMLRLKSDYLTGTAEQRSVALEDGSSVQLAPRSAISVSFTSGERQVRLLRGEAYFEVTRNEHKPFKVLTDDAVTTVLGTGFDVHLSDKGTDVNVRHGRVRLETLGPASGMRILTAGQWAAAGPRGLAGGDCAASLVGSWSGGRLAVVDRPVGEVISDIRRYYRGVIIVRNKEIASRSASGSFDMSNPAAAIQALIRPHGATMQQITPWVIVISN